MSETDTAKKPATTNDAPPVAADPASKAADPANPASGGPKTTGMKIKANYEEIPGASKSGPKAAKAESALFFDPLTISPMSPMADETIDEKGVTKGGGQLISSRQVPIHGEGEDGAGEGTGGLTAQLKYADDINDVYSVKVTGDFPKNKDKAAQTEAQNFIAAKFKNFGDIDLLEGQASKHLEDKFSGAANVSVKISINQKSKQLKDAGKTHVYYKARNNPGILLNVPVVQVAEKVVTSGGTTTKTQGSDVTAEANGSTTTNNVKVDQNHKDNSNSSSTTTTETSDEYHKAVKRTYNEVVTQIENTIQDFASNLVKKADTDEEYHEKGKWAYWEKNIKVQDYTKNVKAGSKEGDKEEKNWAQYLKDAFGVVDDIIDIPILKDLPKVGKYLRKLNQWGWVLDGLEKGADIFAVKGKVHYIDTHEDTKVKSKDTANKDGGGNNSKDITKHTATTATEDLKQRMTKVVSSRKETSGVDQTTTDVSKKTKSKTDSSSNTNNSSSDSYNKTDTTTTAGGSVKAKANQSTTSEITWTQSVKETTTKPILEASIVDGDGEVKTSPFGAPEKAQKKK